LVGFHDAGGSEDGGVGGVGEDGEELGVGVGDLPGERVVGGDFEGFDEDQEDVLLRTEKIG
jgi:hypothetical protein